MCHTTVWLSWWFLLSSHTEAKILDLWFIFEMLHWWDRMKDFFCPFLSTFMQTHQCLPRVHHMHSTHYCERRLLIPCSPVLKRRTDDRSYGSTPLPDKLVGSLSPVNHKGLHQGKKKKKKFSLSPIYTARKSSNRKLSKKAQNKSWHIFT